MRRDDDEFDTEGLNVVGIALYFYFSCILIGSFAAQ